MSRIWQKILKILKFSFLYINHDSKNLIMLDFNHQQPRSLIHILGLQDFNLGLILLELVDSSIDVNHRIVVFERFGETNVSCKIQLKNRLEINF